jgi:hypothetical protein
MDSRFMNSLVKAKEIAVKWNIEFEFDISKQKKKMVFQYEGADEPMEAGWKKFTRKRINYLLKIIDTIIMCFNRSFEM